MPVTRYNNYADCFERKLFGDGDKLALCFHDAVHLLPGYYVRNFYIEDTTDIDHVGPWITTYSLEIVSRGAPIIEHDLANIHNFFQNANQMSIDELLKLVYRRMEDRTL